jgi:hypothetical protein
MFTVFLLSLFVILANSQASTNPDDYTLTPGPTSDNCVCKKKIDLAFGMLLYFLYHYIGFTFLAIDFSASMSVNDMKTVRDFLTKFVANFEVSDQGLDVSITHFWDFAFTNFSFARV